MLNYIWGVMILIGIVTAIFTGKTAQITQAVIDGSRDAVNLAFTMAGVVAVWTGIMNIAQKGGMIKSLAKKIRPILRFLFPDIPDGHPAQQYIATNFTANFLGLGWAATPAGLKAMKELDKLNTKKGTASKSMCMFMVINMSSIQLISINLIAYRAQYFSENPSEILAAALIATIVSTFTGIFAVKVMERR